MFAYNNKNNNTYTKTCNINQVCCYGAITILLLWATNILAMPYAKADVPIIFSTKVYSAQPGHLKFNRNKPEDLPSCGVGDMHWFPPAQATGGNNTIDIVTLNYVEQEQVGQSSNDSPESAEVLPNFGSQSGQNNRVLISGNLLASSALEPLEIPLVAEEDNGSLPLATPLNFTDRFQQINAVQTIGDGPFGIAGTGTGDVDIYSVRLNAGDKFDFFASSIDPNSGLDTLLFLFDEQGNFITQSDNFTDGNSASLIRFNAPSGGIYYFMVASLNADRSNFVGPLDIFDSASGNTSADLIVEGQYFMSATLIGPTETDYYAFDLKRGDVLGAGVNASVNSRIDLFLPDGNPALGSFLSPEFVDSSPLPQGYQAALAYIAPADGRYVLAIGENGGSYELEVTASRPGLELDKGKRQIVYLDFTGEYLNPQTFEVGEDVEGARFMSAFESFFDDWGIEHTSASRAILAWRITQIVRENLIGDFRERRVNPNFDVTIISDFGDAALAKKIERVIANSNDPVSRIIIGGSAQEFGLINVRGLAENIDVGNFDQRDTAIIIAETLGAEIELIPLGEGIQFEDVIATAFGNIASHEIGHNLGNYHADPFSDNIGIMDSGILNILSQVGILAQGSGVFDENAADIDFTDDSYFRPEFFDRPVSNNLTILNTAYALSYIPVGPLKPSKFQRILWKEHQLMRYWFFQRLLEKWFRSY